MPSEQQLSIPGRLPTRDEKQAASAARPDGTSAPLATMADARPQTAGEGAEERRTAPRSARFAEPGPSRPVSTLLKRAWPALAWIGVFSFGLNLLMLVTAVYSLEVFDRVLSSGSHDTLVYHSVIAIAALATLGALDAARGRVLSGVGSWIDAELTPRTIEATLRSRLTGRAQSAQAMRDLGQVRQFIGGQPVLPLFDVWWIPLFIAVLFHMHAWLGWMTVAGALILLALTFLTEALTKKPLQDANRASIEAQMDLDAAIRNAELVQALGMLPRIVRRWADRNNDISAATDRVGRRQAVISGITKFVRLVIQVLIMGAGAALVLKGELTGGGMIAGSILLGRALAPIEQLIGAWRQFVTARTSLSRLEPLLASLPPAVRPTPLPMPSADLQVDRVSFAVPGTNRAVLKSVSFRATPGESIAIVGPSGAGKSTLCKLLCGIWPPATGSIRLDGAEVYAWHRPEFGQHLGYLPQEVELFQGTVRENIARLQDADPEEVIAAAMAADVHKLILQLPDGYDTPLGIGGVMLSGGQRQRIGLARALFRSPQLIVLDEPNSNLDMEGEQALIRAVETAKERGAVVIMVAHRPSSMGAIDKILVLRDGVVEQFGRRDEIMPKIAPVATPAANSAGAPVAAQTQTARVSSLPMDGRSRG